MIYKLEDRILFDAALPVDVADAAEVVVDSADEFSAVEAAANYDGGAEASDESTALSDALTELTDYTVDHSNELYIIDTAVADYQTLVDQVPDGAQIELISPDDDLSSVSSRIDNYENLDSIHIISHGQSGEITIGSDTITSDSLSGFSDEFAGWNNSLAKGADILFYGCEVAKTADGQSLVTQIAQITGADVAASDDATGNRYTADWDLEFTTGAIEAQAISSDEYQGAFGGGLVFVNAADSTIDFDNADGDDDRTTGTDEYWEINTDADLLWLSNNGDWNADGVGGNDFGSLALKMDANYKLTSDITFNANEALVDWDGSGTAGDGTDAAGFNPIGTFTGGFDGAVLDGDGTILDADNDGVADNSYTISNLFADRDAEFQGLFSRVQDAHISNIVIDSAEITGMQKSGVLAGEVVSGTKTVIHNVTVSNSDISGRAAMGGLVGNHAGGGLTVTHSHMVGGSITSENNNIGGLIGFVTINNATVTETIVIEDSSSTTDIIKTDVGGWLNGGLIGQIYVNGIGNLSISNSFAGGTIDDGRGGQASGSTGGLVSKITNDGTVDDTGTATGDVTITNSYSSTILTGLYNYGGDLAVQPDALIGNIVAGGGPHINVDSGVIVAPTVDAITTADTTPVITGTATLYGDMTLQVTVNGAVYDVAVAGDGSWPIDTGAVSPASGELKLVDGNTYTVEAKLVNTAVGTLSTNSGDLTVEGLAFVDAADSTIDFDNADGDDDRTTGTDEYWEINSTDDLIWLSNNGDLDANGGGNDFGSSALKLAANYKLVADIDFADLNLDGTTDAQELIDFNADKTLVDWNGSGGVDGSDDAGFKPIGTFTGDFDGADHTIKNLYIDSTANNNAMFLKTDGASISNIVIDSADITGGHFTGALIGEVVNNDTVVENVTVSNSTVSSVAHSNVGGVVGQNKSGTLTLTDVTVSNSTITSGSGNVGGLVAANPTAATNLTITNSHVVDSDVSGSGRVGGLVGEVYSALTVTNSHVTGGTVSKLDTGGRQDVGGLVASLRVNSANVTIDGSSANTAITSTWGYYNGGLIGLITVNGTGNLLIKDSSAGGSIDSGRGPGSSGGLVGRHVDNTAAGTVTLQNSYSSTVYRNYTNWVYHNHNDVDVDLRLTVDKTGGDAFTETLISSLVKINEGDPVILTDGSSTNYAPEGADKTITIDEDGTHSFVDTDFGFTDVDGGDALVSVTITTLPTAGTLEYNGVVVTQTQIDNGYSVLTADLVNLKFKPSADANGAAYATIGFKVNDGKVSDFTADTITFNVTAVNDAPVIVTATATDVTEDSLTGSLTEAVTDVDTSGYDFVAETVNATITGGTGSGVSGVTVAIATDGAYTVAGTGIETLAATETVNISFDVKVNDGTDDSATKTVTLTITGANDAPVIASATATNVTEDSLTGSLSETVTDVDTGSSYDFVAETVNATIVDGTGSALVSGVTVAIATDGTYTVAGTGIEALAATETVNISFLVTVNDGTVDSATKVVTLTITGTNDAPVIASATASDVTEDSLTGSLTESITDTDTNDTHAFVAEKVVATITGGTGSGVSGVTVDIATDGTYTVAGTGIETLAAGETVDISFDVKVNDGTDDSATKTVTLTITGDNDVPTAVAGVVTETTTEFLDTSIATAQLFDDVDTSDTLVYSASGLPTGLTINSATGVISGSTTVIASHTVDITVTDQNGAGDSVVKQITLDVAVESVAPTTGADSATVTEGESISFSIVANDSDAVSGLDASSIEIHPDDAAMVTVSADGTVTYNAVDGSAGVQTFRYRVSDNRGNVSHSGTDWETVTITVDAKAVAVVVEDTVVDAPAPAAPVAPAPAPAPVAPVADKAAEADAPKSLAQETGFDATVELHTSGPESIQKTMNEVIQQVQQALEAPAAPVNVTVTSSALATQAAAFEQSVTDPGADTQSASTPGQPTAMEVFQDLGVDGNGTYDAREMMDIFQSLNLNINDVNIDIDGDGRIDEKELQQILDLLMENSPADKLQTEFNDSKHILESKPRFATAFQTPLQRSINNLLTF